MAEVLCLGIRPLLLVVHSENMPDFVHHVSNVSVGEA
jgi:hypothetical protein